MLHLDGEGQILNFPKMRFSLPISRVALWLVAIELLMAMMHADQYFEPHLNWVRTSAEYPETVVLIHAVGHDLTYWDRQIEALRDRYNVVAFDLPGHGRSTGLPEQWSFHYAATVVAKLIEEISTTPVHLAGISFGGMIAQVTTLARPDLVRRSYPDRHSVSLS